MDFRELTRKNRSCRRFHEGHGVSKNQLLSLIDLARLCPSAANLQPLKYLISFKPGTNAAIFSSLRWAAALPDWDGPAKGERPAAYITIVLDRSITSDPGCDHGIAAQTILLGAVEAGLGGCMLGAVDRIALAQTLNLSHQNYEILLVIALGLPAEEPEIVDLPDNGSTVYFRDDEGHHYVPKRSIGEIVLPRR